MKPEMKIYDQGLEEYPKAETILGNLMMILWIALEAFACVLLIRGAH